MFFNILEADRGSASKPLLYIYCGVEISAPSSFRGGFITIKKSPLGFSGDLPLLVELLVMIF